MFKKAQMKKVSEQNLRSTTQSVDWAVPIGVGHWTWSFCPTVPYSSKCPKQQALWCIQFWLPNSDWDFCNKSTLHFHETGLFWQRVICLSLAKLSVSSGQQETFLSQDQDQNVVNKTFTASPSRSPLKISQLNTHFVYLGFLSSFVRFMGQFLSAATFTI